MTDQLSALIHLARPRQWVKNAFVAAPLFFTPQAMNARGIGQVALGVAAFCLLSSAAYVVNDWFDREADRQHPEKRSRPLAAGLIAPGAALVFAGVLLVCGLAIAFLALPARFGAFALTYLVLNLAYSFRLKNFAIVDVLSIAIGFVLRVEAGAQAVGVSASVWILICTFLLALFLALAKRRDDLVRTLDASHRASLAGYNPRFIDACLALVLGALLVSYLIYTTDREVIARYGTERLFLTVPFVAAGILRYLQITLVEERSGSPTDLALGDRFLILAVVGWMLTFGLLIYA